MSIEQKKHRVFHIANNYISSKVHGNLVAALSQYGRVAQEVFVPVRVKKHIGVNRDLVSENCAVRYSYCLRSFLKYFPLLKVFWVTLNCLKSLSLRRDEFSGNIIAHSLWSDGMVAFFVSLVKKKQYILLVRNTDINVFLPKLPHYRFLIKRAIYRAEVLVFISHAHKERFRSSYPALFKAASTIRVIPNGVDDFWLNNVPGRDLKAENKGVKQVIYVGRFNENKNLLNIYLAIENARKSEANIVLTLVGGSVETLKALCDLEVLPSWLKVIEHIEDNNHLLALYRESSVFIMPSFYETFGLVYIEALTQGCPFIYTKNEGVDGYFDGEEYAVAVDPNNLDEMARAVLLLLRRFPLGVDKERSVKKLSCFSWSSVASNYQVLLGLPRK